METTPQRHSIEVTNPHELVDVYEITYNKHAPITLNFKLNQKDYDDNDPTHFSLTLANYYQGIPVAENEEYNYVQSTVHLKR